jgi:hypothetical protein
MAMVIIIGAGERQHAIFSSQERLLHYIILAIAGDTDYGYFTPFEKPGTNSLLFGVNRKFFI